MNEITNAAPQVVNLLEQGGVTPEQIEHVAQDLVGEYGWFILAALAAILAKDMIINFAQALLVFMGGDPSYVGTQEVPIQPSPVEVKIVAEEKSTPKRR